MLDIFRGGHLPSKNRLSCGLSAYSAAAIHKPAHGRQLSLLSRALEPRNIFQQQRGRVLHFRTVFYWIITQNAIYPGL
jgi:hypothetical protein